jgi:hypothetical protein
MSLSLDTTVSEDCEGYHRVVLYGRVIDNNKIQR